MNIKNSLFWEWKNNFVFSDSDLFSVLRVLLLITVNMDHPVSFANLSLWSIPIFNSRIHVSKYRKYCQDAKKQQKNSKTIICVIDTPKTPM